MSPPSSSSLVNQLANRYDAGSDGYARFWQPMLAPMGAALLERLPLVGASTILDVGCGTGTLTATAREINENAFVLGVDHSAGMLRHRPQTSEANWGRMDARHLGLAPASFDVAVLAFVVFHFPDIAAGLAEVKRVLHAGGAIGLATFHSKPSFRAKQIWDEQLKQALPSHRSLIADLSAVNQTDKTDQPEKLSDLLADTNFGQVQADLVDFEYQWEPADYISLRASFGSSGAAFRALTGESQQTLLAEVKHRYQVLSDEDFRFKPRVLFVTGRKRA